MFSSDDIHYGIDGVLLKIKIFNGAKKISPAPYLYLKLIMFGFMMSIVTFL